MGFVAARTLSCKGPNKAIGIMHLTIFDREV